MTATITLTAEQAATLPEQRWCWVEDGFTHCADLTPGTYPMFATNYFTDEERSQTLMQVLAEAVPTDGEWKGPDFVNTTLCMYQHWLPTERAAGLLPWNLRSQRAEPACPDCVAHQEYYCV